MQHLERVTPERIEQDHSCRSDRLALALIARSHGLSPRRLLFGRGRESAQAVTPHIEGDKHLFREACRKARVFTRPIIEVSRHVDDRIVSINGSMVIVNDEGWFITAAHLFNSLRKIEADAPTVERYFHERENIARNPTLDARQKRKRISKLQFDAEWLQEVQLFWIPTFEQAPHPLATRELYLLPLHDLAVGHLAGFDPSTVAEYPTFKIVKRGVDDQPGTTLCRMGFPFARIAMEGQPGGVVRLTVAEMTFFPNDGILTRVKEVAPPTDRQVPPGEPPALFIETSTPGLRSQSGGPVFDMNCAVWGIQSHTSNISLGFDPPDPSNPSRTVHQFLNVGLSVHPEIVEWALNRFGVKFAAST